MIRELSDKHDGDLTLVEDFTIFGVVTGTVIVVRGTLLMNGSIGQNLVVQSGGKAIVNGSVQKSVLNYGGHVQIHGTVAAVETFEDGQTHISPSATLRG